MKKLKCEFTSSLKYQGDLCEKEFTDWCISNAINAISWEQVCDYLSRGTDDPFDEFDVEQCVNYQWIKRKASEIIIEFIIDRLRTEKNKVDEYIDYMETEVI